MFFLSVLMVIHNCIFSSTCTHICSIYYGHTRYLVYCHKMLLISCYQQWQLIVRLYL